MRRILVLISGTITGLVGVLAYNPPHIAGAKISPVDQDNLQVDAPVQEPVSSPTAQRKSSTQRKSDPNLQASDKRSGDVKSSAQPNPPAANTTDTTSSFDGDIAPTKYGPVQVRVTVANGVIMDAQALAYPSRDRRSLQISQSVIPWLTQETLRIQSASVMAVSGATITTNAWNRSLESALQKAGK